MPSLKTFGFSLLPTALRIQGRSYFPNLLSDWRDAITGRADPEIPPRHLNISGGGPFREYGRNTVDLCRRYANLTSEDRVLDIGCGIGRTALALADFLKGGRYMGFDIVRFAIHWCQQHIASKHPNFRFVHGDIYNATYNPRGKQTASSFRFPAEANEFTFAIATSLFTHVLPAAADNYIAQASRVLTPGARFLSTWFLLDDIAEVALAEARTKIRFPHQFVTHAQTSVHAPEQAVAYKRAGIEGAFRRHGFEAIDVYRGDWVGATSQHGIESMQDVIVARRATIPE